VAEVITLRLRSAVRDVARPLGLSLDRVDRLAKCWTTTARSRPAERIREAGLTRTRRGRRSHALASLAPGVSPAPSQHVAASSSRAARCRSCAIETPPLPERTVIEWDKDDMDALGILKVDCLAWGC